MLTIDTVLVKPAKIYFCIGKIFLQGNVYAVRNHAIILITFIYHQLQLHMFSHSYLLCCLILVFNRKLKPKCSRTLQICL